jgi:hypothetical protein
MQRSTQRLDATATMEEEKPFLIAEYILKLNFVTLLTYISSITTLRDLGPLRQASASGRALVCQPTIGELWCLL